MVVCTKFISQKGPNGGLHAFTSWWVVTTANTREFPMVVCIKITSKNGPHGGSYVFTSCWVVPRHSSSLLCIKSPSYTRNKHCPPTISLHYA